MSILCYYKDGTPVRPEEADLIARALGFSSATEVDRIVGAREEKNRARGIVSAAAAQVSAVADREAARRASIWELRQNLALDEAAFDRAHAALKRRCQLTGEPHIDATRILRYLQQAPDTELTDAELAAETAIIERHQRAQKHRSDVARAARLAVLDRKKAEASS